jgi:transglutaminase-like putative cysteine protease
MLKKPICFYALFVLSSVLSSLPARATTATLSSLTTDSSQVVISGTTDADTTFIYFTLTLLGSTEPANTIFIKTAGNAFSQTIYLMSGPGTYQLMIAETKGPTQYQSPYYKVTDLTVTNSDPIQREYYFPSTVVQSDDPSIIALAQKITAGITDDLARSKAIHDWVATHISYNLAEEASGNHGDSSALGTLKSLSSVCSGYARLNAALHRAVGIPVRLIDGNVTQDGSSSLHEWDEVLISGNWIVEDPTWDAGGTEDGRFIFRFTETYFNPDPAVFAQDHTRLNIAVNE